MTSALAPNGDASVPGKDEKPSSDVPVIDDDTAERAREIRNEIQVLLNEMSEGVKKMSEEVFEQIDRLKGKVEEIDSSIGESKAPDSQPPNATSAGANNERGTEGP